MIQKFLDTFGTDRIAGILGDREFPNGYLLQWLAAEQIPFYIRIKGNTFTRTRGTRDLAATQLFRQLGQNESMMLPKAVKIFNQNVSVNLAASRAEQGELLIVATNRSAHNALSFYKRRWEIENLFQSLKGRGFRFEDTHITCPERMTKLTALLAVGFVWAHKVGEWRAQAKPILSKQFPEGSRPQYTFFRYGLDFLRETISPFRWIAVQFSQCVQVLAGADPQPAYAS